MSFPRTNDEDDTVTLWSVGHNMPGYLPQRDEPDLCTTWDSARDSLLWEIESKLDYLSEADPESADEPNGWYESLALAQNELAAASGPEWAQIVDDSPSGTSYWIEQVTMTVAEATEAGVEL